MQKMEQQKFANPKTTEMVIGGYELTIQLTCFRIPVTLYGLEELYNALHSRTVNADGRGKLNVHVVALLHGRGGDRFNRFTKDAATLLHSHCPLHQPKSHTFYLPIAFDHRNHGFRKPELKVKDAKRDLKREFRSVPSQKFNLSWSQGNASHAHDMYAIQLGTAMDLLYLMDMLPIWLNFRGVGSSDLSSEINLLLNNPTVKIDQWSVMGVSLGGHAALLALTNDLKKPIHSCVAYIGSGDYTELMLHRLSTAPFSISDPGKLFSPALKEFINKWDPVHHTDRFVPRPLLLYNTAQDDLVPSACNANFAKQLEQEYKRRGLSDRFKYEIEPGVGHKVTSAMLQRGVNFIVQFDNVPLGTVRNRL
jgi:pimeloyl-ACP methyl ester carboxylesterase